MNKISPDLIIRKATNNDFEKIEKVMTLSMRELGRHFYSPEQVASSCKYICVPDKQIISDGTYFVIEDDKGIVLACGGWSFRNTLYAGPKSELKENNILDPKNDKARIRAMFVLPSMSGKGLGSLMLQTCELKAKKAGFNCAALGATQSGLAFYKSKNWISVKEEIALLPDGVTIEIMQMEKNL